MGQITEAWVAFGRLERAMKCLQGMGSINILSFLPWLNVLTGWQPLHRQHDAAEFISPILGKSEPNAYCSGWEPKLQEDGSVDAGSCFAPLAGCSTGRRSPHKRAHL